MLKSLLNDNKYIITNFYYGFSLYRLACCTKAFLCIHLLQQGMVRGAQIIPRILTGYQNVLNSSVSVISYRLHVQFSWLFYYFFIVQPLIRVKSIYTETSPFVCVIWPRSREGSSSHYTYCDWGVIVFLCHPKDCCISPTCTTINGYWGLF